MNEPGLELACPTPPAASTENTHERRQRTALEAHKLEKRLCRQVGQAIIDFNMIEPGDRVMVCLSGGKDSFGLLDILLRLQRRAPVKFDIVAVNLDQKQPGFPDHVLPNYLNALGIEYHIETQDTYSIVKKVVAEGKTMCSLCSRLRRAILYQVANKLNISKIALGHHRDDMLHTFFLNLFFAGKLKSMPAKLVSDDGEHLVIRPLAYVAEKDLAAWAKQRQFPIIPCSLCGNQENLQRQEIKRMVQQWERQWPGRSKTMFTALQNLTPSHLLDRQQYDFQHIRPTHQADVNGDLAFDEEPWPLAGLSGIRLHSDCD